MSQSNFSYQEAAKFDNRSEEEKLLGYKLTLQEIQRQLKPSVDLRKIREQDLDIFIKDLGEIIEEVEKIKNKPNIGKYLRSTDALRIKIREAITELNLDLYLLDRLKVGEVDMKVMRSFYECLNNCREYLDEALQLFLI